MPCNGYNKLKCHNSCQEIPQKYLRQLMLKDDEEDSGDHGIVNKKFKEARKKKVSEIVVKVDKSKK